MDLNLRQVRAFVSVSHLRSFTRAAGLLHLSQPALTVQIQRLEEALDVRLLDRNSRSVALTRIGRELLPVFQRVLRELDAVVVDTRDLAARRHGVVRLACLPSFAAGLLPDAIVAFRAEHPRMSFVVKDVIARRVIDLVRREEVDLGLTGGEVQDAELTVLDRLTDTLHVVYPEGHPIGSVPEVTLEHLAEHPLVLMDAETSVRAVVDAAFVAAGRLPAAACEATYMMTAVGMVRAGLGLTILPGSAREVRAEPGLRARPIREPSFVRPVCLVAKRNRTLPAAAELFLAALRRALAQGRERA
ncbi:HTH-type transcriptional regulator CynR [Methylobacterium crusticola]|uniref:HTH-type transcriptional regulator CynR n=1 Tax=Methylobacterium crusticola TaxID=1697972 RepID=A0ABQ4QYH6_9HYPH|nr:LysR family transcriptional regulator [Methylobacterium crusticola]GJD49925.1 HTH-type transcriptional regulator CynR [Methylobacterium crusticola]